MKRVVEDAKGLYAFGRATRAEPREATEYLLEAARGVRENKQHYEQAERAAQGRPRSSKSRYFYSEPDVEDE